MKPQHALLLLLALAGVGCQPSRFFDEFKQWIDRLVS